MAFLLNPSIPYQALRSVVDMIAVYKLLRQIEIRPLLGSLESLSQQEILPRATLGKIDFAPLWL